MARTLRASDGRPPILVIDGFTPVPMPYVHIRRYYRRHGRVVRVIPFRQDNMKDVVAYAREVRHEACRLMDDTNSLRVDIIGYSMGGVAALYAIKRLDLAPFVRTFVACFAPFRGSKLTRLSGLTGLYRTTGHQLTPDSPFLTDLGRDPLPDGPRYVTLTGTHDLICATESGTLDGVENHEFPTGHWAFYTHPSIHRRILRALA